ncbi:MAG: argininosuccinate lyase, partial [Candidatus Heimdallarchaeota archaeon]|nr:argininosuccinate lyase [Candidatus Heimdallarchaeota archaeon]
MSKKGSPKENKPTLASKSEHDQVKIENKSSSQLWDGVYRKSPTEATTQFIVSQEQIDIDQQLLPYDLIQNEAHILMLYQQKILTQTEAKEVLMKIQYLLEHIPKIDPKLGLHMTIEKLITDTTPAGKKLHTARSRNDQIITITRLFLKNRVLQLTHSIVDFIQKILNKAEQHLESVIAGFTHTQPAQPMTLGFWFTSLAFALSRDIQRLVFNYSLLDQNPLGAGASFGTIWPINRQLTQQLLGFERLQINTLDTITNRGEFEIDLLCTINQIMLHLSHHAEDVILWSGFNLIQIGEEFTHGSSIMPQKQNPDIAELIRANSAILISEMAKCLTILKGLPTGYNRDSRETKTII